MVASQSAGCNRRRRLGRLACAALAVLAAAGVGCGPAGPTRDRAARPALPSQSTVPVPVVAALRGEVQPDLDRLVPEQQVLARRALAEGLAFPGRFKPTLVTQALADPWTGLAALEARGLRLAELAAAGPASLPALIAELDAGLDRSSASSGPPPAPAGKTAEDHLAYLTGVVEEAARWRDRALRKLAPADRTLLFDRAAVLVEDFYPHVEGLSEEARSGVLADERFCRLVAEDLDYDALLAAAQALARLAGAEWLTAAERAFQTGAGQTGAGREAPPRSEPLDGVTGDLLYVRETAAGLLVVGGPGPNRYELDGRIALLLDLGGDDVYRGAVAAPADMERGVAVVIDLLGNDTYEPDPLGLATGRLGVGLLIDRAGDDLYRLASGSGGTGFAGLGLLVDLAGDDRYRGSRFTQGAAIGGLGLLVDFAGRDAHDSFGYALGFGGPLGVGAFLDIAGDDSYQCGGHLPSSYNEAEAPGAGPDDPRYQYDCFGLGMGAGKRVHSARADDRVHSLAGGWGLMLDLAGDDRYRSANFSQGAGYFFGAGLKLDLAGHDEHAAARYGHAAGAHYAAGLFVDYGGGRDVYRSTGPVYNGGAAWDGSVMLGVDAGPGDDRYDLDRSGGLGQAAHRAWGLFIEQGGRDRYAAPIGMGAASDRSLGAFFDLSAEDDYVSVPASPAGRRANGLVLRDRPAGLFLDRGTPMDQP